MSNTSLLGAFGGQAGDALMFRNRIINGDMRIDQRNAGASVANANGFITDRWTLGRYTTGGGAYSGQQVTDAPTGFSNSLKVTVTTNESSQPADAYWQVIQNVEGYNAADLGFGTSAPATMTLSFWVKSSVTGSFSLTIFNNGQGGTTRSYITTYSISAANTWEYKTITLVADGTSGAGFWSTTTGFGASICFDMGSGSSQQGAANTWQTGNFRRISGTTRLLATNGATWQVTGVQLEAGPTATPFERRPYSVEEQMCMRYCEAIAQAGTLQQFPAVRALVTWEAYIPYRVVKRVPPTLRRADSGSFSNVVFGGGAGQCALYNYTTGLNITGTFSFANVTSNSVYRHYLVFGNTSGTAGNVGICDSIIVGVVCFFDAEL